MRLIVVSIMVTLLSGCGSIISRTIPGQGHGNQYYPGVQWDVRDSAWRYVTILDLPFSLVFCSVPPMVHYSPPYRHCWFTTRATRSPGVSSAITNRFVILATLPDH